MSAFALVSTAALRQLDYFPNTATAVFSEREVHAMLSLLLDFPKEVDPKPQRMLRRAATETTLTDCEATTPEKLFRLRGVPSRYKQYFWQISMMLMSGSWLTYLVGVTLYMLTPLTRAKTWSTDVIVSGPYSLAVENVLTSCQGFGHNFYSCHGHISKFPDHEQSSIQFVGCRQTKGSQGGQRTCQSGAGLVMNHNGPRLQILNCVSTQRLLRVTCTTCERVKLG